MAEKMTGSRCARQCHAARASAKALFNATTSFTLRAASAEEKLYAIKVATADVVLRRFRRRRHAYALARRTEQALSASRTEIRHAGLLLAEMP